MIICVWVCLCGLFLCGRLFLCGVWVCLMWVILVCLTSVTSVWFMDESEEHYFCSVSMPVELFLCSVLDGERLLV